MLSDAMCADGPTRIVIPSDPLAVRAALRTLFDTLLLRTMPEDERSTAQLVLAEALNNIVEHAYADGHGEIEVTLALQPSGLDCRIVDFGRPMPGGDLPAGELRPLRPDGDVAEGGFGWHLIRSLSRDLHYDRINGRNLLQFRLDTEQSGQRLPDGAAMETVPHDCRDLIAPLPQFHSIHRV